MTIPTTDPGSFDPTVAVAKRLDHLPIAAAILRQLRVRELVDERVSHDPRERTTAGECLEALILTILTGHHTLYRCADRLEPFDCSLFFDWGDRLETLHDKRLGKALDQVFRAGPQGLYAELVAQAIRAFELEVKAIHTDTTTARLHGAYWGSVEPYDPEDPSAIPEVTYGHSKDHRPDLKQIVFGLSVSGDGGVPIHGRVASGNRADALEFRHALRQVAEVVPDPQQSVVVLDSKGFSGETMQLFREHRVGFVTLMPKSVGLWGELLRRFDGEDEGGVRPRQLLRIKHEEREFRGEKFLVEIARWEGRSYTCSYSYEDKATGVQHEIPLRALVVRSTAQREAKRETQSRALARERKALTGLIARSTKPTFRCQEDAEAAAERLRRKASVFFEVATRVHAEQRRVKRKGPGRPRAEEETQFEEVWILEAELIEPAEERLTALLDRECSFVIVGCDEHHLTREAAPRELFEFYSDQDKVEKVMHWLKGPLRVAPIFLELEERIAAMGLVYVVALMANALIQREARRRLEAAETTMPGNKGFTAAPTTQVVFRLFEGIQVLHDPRSGRRVVCNLNTEQVRVWGLLGIDLAALPGVQLQEPSQPRPGQRAWKPQKRERAYAPPRKRGRRKSKEA